MNRPIEDDHGAPAVDVTDQDLLRRAVALVGQQPLTAEEERVVCRLLEEGWHKYYIEHQLDSILYLTFMNPNPSLDYS